MISFIIIIFCFFLFLFFLFYLAKDDFVIIRRDIPLDSVFSLAILTSVIAMLVARLSYVIFNFKSDFLNPLVFFAIPYFPGLSLIGGVVGAGVFMYAYSILRKMSIGRLADLFTMSFVGVFPVGLILFMVFTKVDLLTTGIMLATSLVLLIFFSKLIFPFSTKGEIRDGSLSFIFTLILSFVSFTTKLLLNIKHFSFLDPLNIFTLLLFFSSIILLINQEVMNKYLPKK